MSSKISTDSIASNPLSLYHCGHEQCKPSHSFGPAIRPHYLFHYILDGKGTYYVNDHAYSLTKGNGFLITPGVTTTYVADEEEPWIYCWIGFDGTNILDILKNCGLDRDNLIFADKSNGELANHLFDLIDCFTNQKGNEYTYIGLLYLCFSHMYLSSSATNKHIYENHMVKALDYIHHNYTYDIKISDVAKHTSIDRTYLFKLFMLYKNLSPQQYLIQYRLNVAKNLLMETKLNMTEIAYSCGFRDASSFNKHFKKQFSITPSQYRYERKEYTLVL